MTLDASNSGQPLPSPHPRDDHEEYSRMGIRRYAALLVLALPACQLQPDFDIGYYLPKAAVAAPNYSIAVLPLDDQRGPKYRASNARGFLTYIPLLPWVSIENNRIDQIVLETGERGGRTWSFVAPQVLPVIRPEDVPFPRSFAMAIAEDLRQSGAASRVDFVENSAQAAGYDYVLSGTLRHDEYRVSMSSYCLGMVGVLLWYLPMPMSRVTGEAFFDLELRDRTGNVVWSGSVDAEEHDYRTLYGSSSMIYGTGFGSLTFQVKKGSDNTYANPHSLFWWSFMALKNGMDQLRPGLIAALNGTAQPNRASMPSERP